jgi:hypothetical protein
VSKTWFWVVCGLIIAIGLAASVWFIVEGLPGHDTNTWHAAAVIGSLLVAVGWMVTSLNNIRSRELEYTLRVLAEYRVSPESKKRWGIINEFLKTAQTLSLRSNKGEPICEAVSGELDDYEFIASGAVQGIYDNKMLRYELRSDFTLLYGLAEQYIQEIQAEDEDPELWESFCKLCRQWLAEQEATTDNSERNVKLFLCVAVTAGVLLLILRWR